MLTIVQSPDPVLNTPCEPCTPGDKKLVRLAKNMLATMYKAGGCGLAAPQVGEAIRLVVVDCAGPDEERDPIVLVNPQIMELRGDAVTDGEGCLSLPGITVPIARKPWARVRYYDLAGELWEVEGDGLLGRCLQHEIDHLNGVTMFEACSPEERLVALRKYDEARKAGAKPGDTSI